MSEAVYQRNLIEQLRKHGAWVVKYPAGPHGTIGTPDLLCCYRGYFLAIECKAGDPDTHRYAPTPMQTRQLDAIHEAGGIGITAWPGLDVHYYLTLIDQLADLTNAKAKARWP